MKIRSMMMMMRSRIRRLKRKKNDGVQCKKLKGFLELHKGTGENSIMGEISARPGKEEEEEEEGD